MNSFKHNRTMGLRNWLMLMNGILVVYFGLNLYFNKGPVKGDVIGDILLLVLLNGITLYGDDKKSDS